MVYWGCGTTKNRCMWAVFATSAIAGGLLLIAGGTKLDICSKLPLRAHISAGACSAGPVAMMVIGAFVLLGTVPSLLFFSGCARGPPQTKYAEGVPASGITVVRRTADGPQMFHYDSAGRLIAAPDCKKHAVSSSQYVLKGIKTAPALSKGCCSSNSSSPSNTPRHPLLLGVRSRLYDSDSGDTATAEVYVSAFMPQHRIQQQQQQQYVPQEGEHVQQQQQQRQQEKHEDARGRASPQLDCQASPQPDAVGPLAAGRIMRVQRQQQQQQQRGYQQQMHMQQQSAQQPGHDCQQEPQQ